MPKLLPILLAAVACVASPADASAAQVLATADSERGKLRLVQVAAGLEHPWGLAFLPDGRLLVTERAGRLRIVGTDGVVGPPLAGVPAVEAVNQGGLLDVALDPGFTRNGLVYLSYTEPRGPGVNATSVARGRLAGPGLVDVQVIFRQQPAVAGGHHFGSRLVFARDGRLFVTLGDRNSQRDRAQTLDSHIGKVVRIEPDGGVPKDNPFVDKPGALPEIWSYGHRNIQGAALHPATGELWTHEHGPRGGDEFNRTLAGRNYGWPLVTHGTEYSGKTITDKTSAPGMESPARHWTPSIAVSGLAFYDGERLPAWRGNAFIGGLKSQQLVRLELEGNAVVHEERLLRGELRARVRDVRQGPDGYLYLLTDETNGRVLRIEPAP